MSRSFESKPDIGSGYDDCLAREVVCGIGQCRELGDKERADEICGAGKSSVKGLDKSSQKSRRTPSRLGV